MQCNYFLLFLKVDNVLFDYSNFNDKTTIYNDTSYFKKFNIYSTPSFLITYRDKEILVQYKSIFIENLIYPNFDIIEIEIKRLKN